MKQQINVQGMTCEHCVKAVAEELSALTGVTDVQIDLVPDGTSTVVVESDRALTDEQIRMALSEAGGYQSV
ncbi:MAG: heavy-metal-associated domain-containing protein [Candidatus Nanopelagicales bacterium]|jgi:copper chaperone CopZ